MKRRPLLAGTAALAALGLATAAGAASGPTTVPAKGSASSTVSLLRVRAAGHDLRAVDLALRSDTTTSPRVSRISVVPVVADGTPYGEQVIDQSNSPQGIGSQTTPSALAALAKLVSPPVTATASSTPSNEAGAASLGSLSLLGLPVALNGSVQATSEVTSADGAAAGKTVVLKNLALPSVADLLAALGLDLKKLPVGSLSTLVDQLNLVTSAVTTAQSAVDTAQSNVDAAVSDLAAKNATLTSAQGSLTSAQATLTAATATLQGLLDQIATLAPAVLVAVPDANTIAGYATLVSGASPLVSVIETAIPGTGAAFNAYTVAQTAVTAAQTALSTAQAAVNAAETLLTTLQNTLTGVLTTLQTAVIGVLDDTPLVSLAKLEVSTRAIVSSATAGGQKAQIVGGAVTGLKVLGTDVLDSALGSSTVDLSALTGTQLGKVTTAISGLTGTLSHVLSSIPSLPLLEVPAPKIGLLTKSTSTSVSDGFGRAINTVTGLSVALPAITLPSSVALPGASSLPALGGVTQIAGRLTSAPVTITLLTLQDQAAFRPAVVTGSTQTPGTTSPGRTKNGLPDTGLPVGVAVLALAVVGSAFALRRQFLSRG